jgi:hypothetical protein
MNCGQPQPSNPLQDERKKDQNATADNNSRIPGSRHRSTSGVSYKIDTDKVREPDAAAFELRKKAQAATDHQIIRMLVEIALLPSGYSDEKLEASDPLASAARRYNVSLAAKKPTASKGAKCATKSQTAITNTRKAKSTQGNSNSPGKKAMRKGGAA